MSLKCSLNLSITMTYLMLSHLLKFYHFRDISVNKIISASIPSSQAVVISSNTNTNTITLKEKRTQIITLSKM